MIVASVCAIDGGTTPRLRVGATIGALGGGTLGGGTLGGGTLGGGGVIGGGGSAIEGDSLVFGASPSRTIFDLPSSGFDSGSIRRFAPPPPSLDGFGLDAGDSGGGK